MQVVYTPTNTSYGVVTNSEGRYFLANLNPGGPYEITITFVGYKTENYKDINLKLGETQKLDVLLQEDAQLLASGIEQSRNADGTPAAPHQTFKPHPMQGWTPDFIPKLTGDVVGTGVIHRILPIANADALRCSEDLAKKEGIFVGITSGATFAGALQVVKDAPKGATVLCMLPDTGERYLSTPLFAAIPADMTPEEVEISRSTPTAQMGA